MRPNPSQTPESAGERGSSAPAAARHRPKVDEVRIGLALSGGGFRATLFHLVVVRYLLDAGLLKRVRCICSAPGRSPLGAHLVHNWSAYNWLEGVTTEEDLRPVTKQIVPQRPGHKADRVFRAVQPADFEEAAAQIIAFTKKDVL